MLNTLFPSQFGTLNHLSRQMDRLFDAVMPQSTLANAWSNSWPGLNVWRDNDSIVAEAEVPGFTMEHIEVLATEDSLTLRGQRQPSTPENATPIRVERSVTQFERTIQLPVEIDPDAVQATLNQGVLTITMPIAQSARPRQIPVKSSQALPSGN